MAQRNVQRELMGIARRELVCVGGACVVGATGLFYAVRWIRRFLKDYRHPLVPIGTVSELFIYPVKSCRGRSVDSMECSELCGSKGELRDHHFQVYKPASNMYLTTAQNNRMLVIDSDVHDGVLTMTAPGHSPMHINIQQVVDDNKVVTITMYNKLLHAGLDCGEEVGRWLSDVLNEKEPLGLLYYRDGLYTNRWSERGWRWFFGLWPIKDKIAYYYLAPYMAFSSQSVTDLNSHLDDEKHVGSRNFRGNIVIAGCPPFDEDKWMELRIGDAQFECYQPCARCVITTIDPSTGIRDPQLQPLRTLRKYRLAPEGKLRKLYKQDPIFGVYMGLDHKGTIHVGDQVYARYKSHPF